MLPMTCLEGKFTNPYPESPSVSETIVRAPGGGAVVNWGPTGLGVAYGHDQLNRGFLDAVFARGIRGLGLAAFAGKLRLYGAGHSITASTPDLVLWNNRAWVVIGTDRVYLPLILRRGASGNLR